MRATARFAILFFACLLGVDVAFDALLRRTDMVTDIVDIQTPATLYAKLDHLRRFEGVKVVLVGDSVVYGRAMQDAGDADWRRHTLSAQLQERLAGAGFKRQVLVMNLGLNGALPVDIERLMRILVPLGVHKVVLDVTLRSFSGDFSAADARASRPWLESMSLDRDGRFRQVREGATVGERIETGLRAFMINHWTLYRMRDFVQWRLFNGEPAMAVRNLRARLDALLRGGANQSADDLLFAQALLKLKAKNRHESIDLSPSNPQREAFKRTLEYLSAANQPTVLFYATEDAEQIKEIVDPGRYLSLLDGLRTLIAASGNSNIAYVPPADNLRPEHYVDYVHPNQAGYSLLADALLGRVAAGLK